MKFSALALFIFLLYRPESLLAQPQTSTPQPTEGRVGIGGVGGPGTAGLIAAARLSIPAAPRISFDIDGGLVSASSDRARATFGGQVRWLRTPRRRNGSSDYGIFGLMHLREERRTEIRFPAETIVQTERVNGITPVVGYGVDWVHSRGTRLGLELTGGGSENAGPRLFAKVFFSWSPAPAVLLRN